MGAEEVPRCRSCGWPSLAVEGGLCMPCRLKKCGLPTVDDPVQRPLHYNQGPVECLDAMRAAFGEEALRTYAHVNALKYVWRASYKNGTEDLQKAIFYLRVAMGEDPREPQ